MTDDKWSEQEEKKIDELMKELKYTRLEAIRRMQRMKQKNVWRPTDVRPIQSSKQSSCPVGEKK
jgi:hypothetical protein